MIVRADCAVLYIPTPPPPPKHPRNSPLKTCPLISNRKLVLWGTSPPSPQEVPLLQGNFQTQELNRGLLHGRRILHQLSYQGSLVSFGGKDQILAQASINLHDTSKLPRAEKQDFFLFSG